MRILKNIMNFYVTKPPKNIREANDRLLNRLVLQLFWCFFAYGIAKLADNIFAYVLLAVFVAMILWDIYCDALDYFEFWKGKQDSDENQ
jgi:hypothetical protein